MRLIIFDLDGTLTGTAAIDADCYERVFAEEFNLTDINTAWDEYTHYTDSGIAREIFLEKIGRPPSPEENRRLKKRFVEMLADAGQKSPGLFAQIPGAGPVLRRLKAEGDWRVAIATGCWLDSVRLKAKKASLDLTDIPLATADDSIVREEIVNRAIEKARTRYRAGRFERMVYVGDGVWDVRTSSKLGIPFIGVGDENKQKILRAAGARHLIFDFTDYAFFMSLLEEATVPQSR